MNKSSVSNKILINISTDDKKLHSNENNKQNYNIITLNFKKNINNNIYNLKDIIKKIFEGNTHKNPEKIDSIIKHIEFLFNKYINDINEFYVKQYENILRYYEEKIRILYENQFNLELKKRILEESNYNLLRKEKEYELIKARTGIIIQNGKIIDNNRKENEILILKKENSILKDAIEKQRLDILLKGRKIQKKNHQINKKIILKLHLKSKKLKILSHHSHPKSNPHYHADSNSLLNYKSIISHKTLLNNSFSKKFNTENSVIHNSSRKNKTIKNYTNIQIKRLCSKIIDKKHKKGNNKYIINKKHKSFNPPLLGMNMNGTFKDNNKDKENISENKKRNYSEYFINKKTNLLMIKTVNNENICKRKKNYFRFLSPTNRGSNQINNLIPKSKKHINEIKYSHSFTLKNNVNNNTNNIKNNKCDSEKIISNNNNISNINNNSKKAKIENKIKKINLIIKNKKKSNSKSKTKSGSKKNSNSKNNNNIHIINYTSINNFINKTKSNSKK